MNNLRSTFFLTLCILFTSNVVFAKIPTEAAFIVGEWESTDSTNRYRMRVFWNDSNNEFKVCDVLGRAMGSRDKSE